jgi:signal transduction histidine kinase
VTAAVIGFIQIVGTAGAAHRHVSAHSGCWWGSCAPHHLTAVAWVLLALGPIALVLRNVYPRAVLAFVFTVTAVYGIVGYPAGPVFLSLIIAFATVILSGYRWFGGAAIATGWALFLWLPSAFGTGSAPGVVQAAGLAAWLLALLAMAEAVRSQRERRVAVGRTRREEGLRHAEEERVRIARELHDVLAHNISLINVQSGVALHLLEEQPEQARTALSIINEASADALREMRSVLGVLRRVDERAPRAPAAGLDRLAELVSRSAAAGVTVDVRTEGEPRPLATSIDLAAYRIVQESLTNVARHAGSGQATVSVGYGPQELTLQIDDDGHGRAVPVSDGAGSGIAGMRERAAALGGRLQAGPRPGGGFRVQARIPLGGRA